MKEFWLPAPGYEGLYEVSDIGNVKSMPRLVIRGNGNPLPVRGRILKICVCTVGYPVVVLCGRGAPKSTMVHRIVAEAFLGPQPHGMEVDHRNGKRDDNRAVNLRWVTRAENIKNRFPYEAGVAP